MFWTKKCMKVPQQPFNPTSGCNISKFSRRFRVRHTAIEDENLHFVTNGLINVTYHALYRKKFCKDASHPLHIINFPLLC